MRMEMRSDSGVHDLRRSSPARNLQAMEPVCDVPKCDRGVALLKAMSEGDEVALAALLTADVRLTSFDRGEIHEAEGRALVCERLTRLAEIVSHRFVPNGTRDAEDALFLWGGASESNRPSWMITLFFRHDRFFDVRVYLLG